jgi:hypothetical protein
MTIASAAPAPSSRRHWSESLARRLITACDLDPRGVVAFCRRRGISRERLRYWRQRLAAEVVTPGTGPFVELRAASLPDSGPVREPRIVVHLREGVWLEVGVGFDASLLRSVVEALS